MTTHRTARLGILIVAVVLVSVGCASMAQQGTVVPIQQSDLASLAGVWSGYAYAGATGKATIKTSRSFHDRNREPIAVKEVQLISKPRTTSANERASEPTRAEWGLRGPASERVGESEGRSLSE